MQKLDLKNGLYSLDCLSSNQFSTYCAVEVQDGFVIALDAWSEPQKRDKFINQNCELHLYRDYLENREEQDNISFQELMLKKYPPKPPRVFTIPSGDDIYRLDLEH